MAGIDAWNVQLSMGDYIDHMSVCTDLIDE